MLVLIQKKIVLGFLAIAALYVPVKCFSFDYSFSGTFTNNLVSASGTIVMNMDMTDDSVLGYVNFTGYPGNLLCAAGNFNGTRMVDSLITSFVSNDTDAGCGFDHGQIVELRLRFFNGCDSISGIYVNNGSVIGNYSLVRTSKRACLVSAITEPAANYSLTVSPNPAQESIYISCAGFPVSVSFYSLSGQLVVKQTFCTPLDISPLKPGAYLIEVSCREATLRKMFIKM